MAYEFTIDESGFAEILARADRLACDIANTVADDARELCPVHTGELKASIHTDGNRVVVGTDHWAPVEFGAQPHVIESHGDYPLRNRETGQVFGHTVHHPGNRAQPFLRPALYKWRTQF